MIVVIPSVRSINTHYIEPLIDAQVKIIVVYDSDEEKIRPCTENMYVLHYPDRKRLLGDLDACIPRKTGACRDLGLLFAYLHGGKNEVIVCLDDDCEVSDDFIVKAESSLGSYRLPLAQTQHRFYNFLDLYDLDEQLYPRGFPYEARGKSKDYTYEKMVEGNVVFNLGLWSGVFDVNAIDKLYLSQYDFKTVKLKFNQVAVQRGTLVSLCSMNMILKRELIPAIYQLPMNEPIILNWTIDRYGDIWGGYICKKLIDIKGDLLSVGEPLIRHHKNDNKEVILKNIKQEHYAHLVNPSFCDLVERACEEIDPDDYMTMYEHFVHNLDGLKPHYPRALRPYLEPTVQKMHLWIKALKRID